MPATTVPTLLRSGGVVAGVAAAGLGYAVGYEVRSFRLRRVTVPVLPRGARPVRVLHLSDLHLTPTQRRKRAWVNALAGLEPDLVIDTGDNLGHLQAVPSTLDALGALLDRPGAFVFGSNDYWAPIPKNPVRYFRPGEQRHHGVALPWRDLQAGLVTAGWADLSNARTTVKAGGLEIELVGVDDPHIDRDRYERVAGAPDRAADLTLGVVHAPYRRVLDAMAADRLPLILAGHTHGGQVCVPGWGALVSNCDLPVRQAKGLSHWKSSWLHVSAGLGTSPYTPIRFACPPEATLLTLVPREHEPVPAPGA